MKAFVKVVLKNRKDIIKILTDNNGDLTDVDNKFYIDTISGSKITLIGYCAEEDNYVCKEFPQYIIPSIFISNVIKYEKIQNNFEYTYTEIGQIIGCSSENARKITRKALGKISKKIDKSIMEIA